MGQCSPAPRYVNVAGDRPISFASWNRAGGYLTGITDTPGSTARRGQIASGFEVIIHADESCLGNQFAGRDRPGGAAALLEHWTGDAWERRDLWICDRSTTNNRMALMSAIVSLGALKGRRRVAFVSDSQYLVKGASEWMPAWKRRGWKRKGGPIENLGLWRRLDGVAAGHDVVWRWVRGHAGDPRNEYVDELAQRAAREQSARPEPGPSGFEAWLEEQRETMERYFDYHEFAPPGSSTAP